MKTLIAILLLSTASVASAHDWYHSRGGYGAGYYGSGISPGAAAVIGGIIGYGMGRGAAPVYSPPPVYYPPAPVYDNVMPPAPPGYTYSSVWDSACRCYRYVLVPY